MGKCCFVILLGLFSQNVFAKVDFCDAMNLPKFRADITYFPSDPKNKPPTTFVTLRHKNDTEESCRMPTRDKKTGQWLSYGESFDPDYLNTFPDPSEKENKKYASFYKKYCNIGTVSKPFDDNRDGLNDYLVTYWDHNGVYGGPSEDVVHSSLTPGYFCIGLGYGYATYAFEGKRKIVNGFSLPVLLQSSGPTEPGCLTVLTPVFKNKTLQLESEPMVFYGIRTRDPKYIDSKGNLLIENFEDCDVRIWAEKYPEQVESQCEESILKRFADKYIAPEIWQHEKCFKKITSMPELEGQIVDQSISQMDPEKFPYLKDPKSFGRYYHRGSFRARPTPEKFQLLFAEDQKDLTFLKKSLMAHYVGKFDLENKLLQTFYVVPKELFLDDELVKKIMNSGGGCHYSVEYLPGQANEPIVTEETKKILEYFLEIRSKKQSVEEMYKLIMDLKLNVGQNYACLLAGTDEEDHLRLEAFSTKKGFLDFLIDEGREDIILRFLKFESDLRNGENQVDSLIGFKTIEGSKNKEFKKALVAKLIPLIKKCPFCFLERKSNAEPWGSRWDGLTAGLEAKDFPEKLMQFETIYSLCGSNSSYKPITSWEQQEDFFKQYSYFYKFEQLEKSQLPIAKNLLTEMCLFQYRFICDMAPKSLACDRSKLLFKNYSAAQ